MAQNNHSVLWSDSTTDGDRSLVEFLVDKIVAGKKVAGHHEKCVDKIMATISTKEWQETYPHRTHIFSVYYGISIKNVIEVRFSLYAQALELMYYNITNARDNLTRDNSLGFDQRLRIVFQDIYKWDMPFGTADAIRILRNDVMHYGTIAGVEGAYRNPNDPETLRQFFIDSEFNKNTQSTENVNRMRLASQFNYLVEEMLVRTLGLSQKDLTFNGAPAWATEIFGYNHENRPDWLR